MTEVTQKKGMSKGCLIALIAAVILVIVIIIGGWLIVNYKDDIAKYVIIKSVNSAKVELAAMEEPYVDTVIFNSISDSFIVKFEVDTIDIEEGGGIKILSVVQDYASNKKLDSSLAIGLLDGMITLYPDLAEMLPPVSEEYIDSLAVKAMPADSM